MFTGLIEETGRVTAVQKTPAGIRLELIAPRCGKSLRPGDSLAVNGCCLTMVGKTKSPQGPLIRFDLLEETWTRTNLQYLERGSLVNLERALSASSRLGGHFVTGHVDDLGEIVQWERSGQDHVLDIKTPVSFRKYVVFKGSVAVDGISLTVAKKLKTGFRIWIIPHTFEVTNLQQRKVGDRVNLEGDLLGKYVEQFLSTRRT